MRNLPLDLRSDGTYLLALAPSCAALMVPDLLPGLRADALFQLELLRVCPGVLRQLPLRSNATFLRAAVADWLLAQHPEMILDRERPQGPLPACLNLTALTRFFQGALGGWPEERAEGDAGAPSRKKLRLSEILQCPICRETVKARVQQCRNGHVFCALCIDSVVDDDFSCPVCRTPHTRLDLPRCLVAEQCARLE